MHQKITATNSIARQETASNELQDTKLQGKKIKCRKKKTGNRAKKSWCQRIRMAPESHAHQQATMGCLDTSIINIFGTMRK